MYLINQLKPIWTYFRNWCQVIFAFLLRFLFSGIFATLYQYSSEEKMVGIMADLGDIA